MKRIFPAAAGVVFLGMISSDAAIVVLGSGTYTENFNSISTTAAAGWDAMTGASATSPGTVGTYTATAGSLTTWGDSGGSFKNFAAAGAGPGSSPAVQTAATDRALGVRQTGSFGDPGASFSFGFSSSGLTIQGVTIDLQMLSVQPRSTVWSIQYGIGASPAAFVTLATFADPGVFGSTAVTIPAGTIGTALDNQAQAWFRVVALAASTGSGNRDSFAIDNFTITAVPEPAAALLGAFGLLGILRRRR